MSDVAPRRKLRALELKTAEGWRRGRYSGPRVHETKKDRDREAEFAEQMETAYRRLVADWQPKPTASGAGATWGRASQKPPSGKQRGKATVPNPALELVVARTNNDSRTKETNRPEALTFISVREPHGSEGFSFGREYAHPHDPAVPDLPELKGLRGERDAFATPRSGVVDRQHPRARTEPLGR